MIWSQRWEEDDDGITHFSCVMKMFDDDDDRKKGKIDFCLKMDHLDLSESHYSYIIYHTK